MRKARVGFLVVGFLLAACGGSDFVAAPNEDAGWHELDSNPPTPDSHVTPPDGGMTTPDAPASDDAISPAVDSGVSDASHGDDGVPDANGERVVRDATTVSSDAPGVDAAPDAPVTCDAPSAFYRDRDRDGFGSTDDSLLACVPPAADDAGAWVAEPGDCRDDLFEVKPYKANSPDPPKYWGTGYLDPVRPRGVSFDYDCNGTETTDPSNQFGPAPTCPALATGCNGTGYMPASPARSGVGVNPLCGSTTLRSCVVQGLNCNEQYIQMATPFRCR